MSTDAMWLGDANSFRVRANINKVVMPSVYFGTLGQVYIDLN